MYIKSINKVYIHNGEFNADDIISTALIKMTNKNIVIERVSSRPILKEDELCLGIAGKYDYNSNKYLKDNCGNPYCLTTYVSIWCLDELFKLFQINNTDKANKLFYERYISKVAIGTRKKFFNDKFFRENRIVLDFNSHWYEEVNGITNSDNQFFKAVDLMMIVIENWLKQIKEDSDLREVEDEIWNKAEETQEEGIYVLEKHIPWQYQVKKNPDTKAKIIIFKSNRGGYNVVSKSTDEIEIQDSEYLSFIHPSRFMGVAKTLNNAILAARQTIKMVGNAI